MNIRDESRLSIATLRRLNEVCEQYEAARRRDESVRIEILIDPCRDEDRAIFLRELLYLEYEYRMQQGDHPTIAEYVHRFPNDLDTIRVVDSLARVRCRDLTGRLADEREEARFDTALPESIDRYEILRLLGEGNFGKVYLAYDPQIDRRVAIKVPKLDLPTGPNQETLVREAKSLGRLKHPNIVPVYDAGTAPHIPFYIVSEYIVGEDLAHSMHGAQRSPSDTCHLVATLADALHHAHIRGLVHQDIKPANVLVSSTGIPYISDFGLAIQIGEIKTARLGGTPAYMSPEQVRGEGHLVDRRSDIFSLGVLLYELLTGQRPFPGPDLPDILAQIVECEPRRPTDLKPELPVELDRICLRAIAKKAVDRYPSAADFADELRDVVSFTSRSDQDADCRDLSHVIPKGLRAFDVSDANFFLDLLPGRRGREGLPDSVRFWKTRIETFNFDQTFRVGLIWGPSGCGKSSFVRAGLLPRLDDGIKAIYVAASGESTEQNLLAALRREFKDADSNDGLGTALTNLCRNSPPRSKVLIIIDQFEQWLQVSQNRFEGELLRAIRQCDGVHLQCILMVRDDFSSAITRFFQQIEVAPVPGENAMFIDLLDGQHAKLVLEAFGRANGVLPAWPASLSIEQSRFLADVTGDLSEAGKVHPVRLALFADMTKSMPWTPAGLASLGSVLNVGTKFLEFNFGTLNRDPMRAIHRDAIVAVLNRLLPGDNVEIKGHSCSELELKEASGYASAPEAFQQLIHIVDSETRLVTPVEADCPGRSDDRRFQLTHDFLVPSLRQWLRQRQMESRGGRAELRLQQCVEYWAATNDHRHLPSWSEFITIWTLTNPRDWTASQHRTMAAARKLHLSRTAWFVAAACVVLVLGFYTWGRMLVSQLATTEISGLPAVLEQVDRFKLWTQLPLRRQFEDSTSGVAASKGIGDEGRGNTARLRAALGLARGSTDARYRHYVFQQLLTADPESIPIMVSRLSQDKDEFADTLWNTVQGSSSAPRRLRAASALAGLIPRSPNWKIEKVTTTIAADVVAANAIDLAAWLKQLSPIRNYLIGPLSIVFRDSRRSNEERSLAAEVLAVFARDDLDVLLSLVLDAQEFQIQPLLAAVQPYQQIVCHQLESILQEPLPPERLAREGAAKRLANAGAIVLHFKDRRCNRVWPLLQHRSDPRVRSYLVHRLRPFGVDPNWLCERLVRTMQDSASNVSFVRALVLALGEFPADAFRHELRTEIQVQLQSIYRQHPDAGLHAAAEWTMRRWRQDMPLLSTKAETHSPATLTPRGWYVDVADNTMVLLGPGRYWMGAREGEPESLPTKEVRHAESIDYVFAMSSKEVTREQFLRYPGETGVDTNLTCCRTLDSPQTNLRWQEAAGYCNWLSREAGLPEDQWCFDIVGDSVRICTDWESRTGYRMPTEVEWEYACRANSVTARYFGETAELLPKYAWAVHDSTLEYRAWPVGSLKPNDFGLFDMHGNIQEWCLNTWVKDHSKQVEIPLVIGANRVTRSGSFYDDTQYVRSAARRGVNPMDNYDRFGLRVVRKMASD